MGQHPHTPSSSSISRRSFFRQILVGGIDQIENVGRKILPDTPEGDSSPSMVKDRYLRPPGAVPANRFASHCSGCRACVCACPAQCIQLDDTDHEKSSSQPSGRLPYIVARQAACVICDDLACTRACPTGALHFLENPLEIRMGTAVMHHQRCLRSLPGGENMPPPSSGEPCRICVDQCPVGPSALDIDTDGLVKVGNACVGCGVCEWVCPTEPASIQILPDHGTSG